MNKKELTYNLAFTLAKGIGPVYASKMLDILGSAEQFFEAELPQLKEQLPGLPSKIFQIDRKELLSLASKELDWAAKNGVRIITFTHPDYPSRLRHIPDKPLALYIKGEGELNWSRTIGIVGTRKATDYGKRWIATFVRDLRAYQAQVISGLAYGIDVTAHIETLRNGMSTVGVLGHGLGEIYPRTHHKIANDMLENGALISEFSHDERPNREHFPMRNRIIAGLSDVLIVVESGISGGSMISAELAIAYNKDVFVLPGRHNDRWSSGCLKLIKEHKARIVTSAADVATHLNWKPSDENLEDYHQIKLFQKLSENEKKLFYLLKNRDSLHKDLILHEMGIPMSNLNNLLLEMELKGLIRSAPGNMYHIN